MTKTVYDQNLLKIMELFESITKVKLKDCFVDSNGRLTFIVPEGEIMKALGKDLSNLKKIESLMDRKVKVIEFSDNLLQFIKNIFYPNKIVDIKQEGSIVVITGGDVRSKGLMIGAKAKNLRNAEFIVRKYFEDLEEIKVI